MSKTLWKPGAMLSPVPPAMVSCGTVEKPNIITVGWTGMLCTRPPMTYISLRPERYSYDIIKESGEFVINLAGEKLAFAADFCGVRSGRDVSKFEHLGLTPSKCSIVTAPLIEESVVSIECKVVSITPLGTHDMFMAEILAVHVEDSICDSAGKPDFTKCGLLAYSHGEYFTLGKKLGSFGFSVRKKKKKRNNKK